MGSNERRHRRLVHQSIYIGIGVLVLLAVVLYGRNLEQQSTHFFVKFKNPDGTVSEEFKLEIADTEAERAKGLMFRKTLPENEGMIFAYPQEKVLSFWMKNTYVSLDLIFINKDWQVTGILPEVPILNSDQRKSDSPNLYAVELLAGRAKANKITIGSKVQFSGTAPTGKP